jgi:hypothetical protein
VQDRDQPVGQCDPCRGQEVAGLVPGETQLRGTDLGQLPGQPEPVQAQRGFAASGHDRVRVRWQARQQPGELLDGVGRTQLVQVVDHQDEGTGELGQFGAHPVDHGRGVEPGRRRRRLGSPGRRTDRVQQGQPEQLRIVLVRPYRQERDRAILLHRPRTQQRGLPAARRRGDDRHPRRGYRTAQRRDQIVPLDQSLPGGRAAPRGRHLPRRAICSRHLASLARTTGITGIR